jgi:transcriptional regulator GlxA family with amidase domain
LAVRTLIKGVEKYCGHETAMQCAKAMLIETPRTWQAGFAVVPRHTQHHDESIAKTQAWMPRQLSANVPF